MSHKPSTFRGEPGALPEFHWDDDALLHRTKDQGLLSHLTASRHGNLADLVRYVALLPEAERESYAIEHVGDHRLNADEIMALYNRADFPHA